MKCVKDYRTTSQNISGNIVISVWHAKRYAFQVHRNINFSSISNGSDPEITCGLSDVYVLCGNPAELNVKMNVDCEGAWFKDGEQVNA